MFTSKLVAGALAFALVGSSAFAGDPFKEAQKEVTKNGGNQALIIRQETNGQQAQLFKVPTSEIGQLKALRGASNADRARYFDEHLASLTRSDANLGTSALVDNDKANQACYGYYYWGYYYAPITWTYYYYPTYIYYPVYYTYYYYQWTYYYSGYNYVVYY